MSPSSTGARGCPRASGVDEPGPLAVQLMGKAAGAHNEHAEVLGVGGDGPADRFAEVVATRGRRQRELDRVDLYWHDPHRPRFASRPQQCHRVAHRVVDDHLLLACRDVEILGDHGVDDVPRQAGVPGEREHGRDVPAFVCAAVLGRRADRERRQLVEEEVQPVVVVDDHGDVRLRFAQPLVHGLEPVEEGLPVRLFLLPLLDRPADRRDVRRRDAADDPGHRRHLAASASSRALNSSLLTPVCCAPMSCTSRPKIPANFAR
jgi:hypothetical protein